MTYFPRIEDLPDDGSRQKEVYAAAGLALYKGQVWERGMINLVLIMNLAKGKIADVEDWDRREVDLSSLTAGRLRKLIEKEGLAPIDTLEMWGEARDFRNYLAHRFFYENAVSFMTDEGSQAMLDELDKMIRFFEAADRKTRSVVEDTSRKLGITHEVIKEMGEQLVEEYKESI
ncbi:hypothetical protein M0E87_09230 [Corynebacterium sp. CCM 9185]|uniref:DUF4145 domain-containing protein n=1 Tax=Corynebacterium marambiense TaxID=2765364 RepID=A0ABS0VX06_9CORY|nr:hypothetical protein [Corynebacterium marambiense]MBI9001282.1 hypothetical protein [Corynebacterium marambiense]MCK7663837.1 hypothetical protein [Corynebacterium marambiense]